MNPVSFDAMINSLVASGPVAVVLGFWIWKSEQRLREAKKDYRHALKEANERAEKWETRYIDDNKLVVQTLKSLGDAFK